VVRFLEEALLACREPCFCIRFNGHLLRSKIHAKQCWERSPATTVSVANFATGFVGVVLSF
jgi:hypothetical protein